MGEKTEKASPKKLRDARKKGQVAKSQDLPAAATFIASMAIVMANGAMIYEYMTEMILKVFAKIPRTDIGQETYTLMYEVGYVVFIVSVPICMAVALVGVFVNFAMIGPIFSTEVFKFDPKKFDPIQNLKSKFKLKTLVELIKSIFKISIAAYICYNSVMAYIPEIIAATGKPLVVSLIIVSELFWDVVIKVGLFFVFVAVLDFGYQKYNYEKEMMMEKFEVKQEYKNTEGDPEIKGQRKQIAREIAFGGGPPSPKGSSAVVTNPTHLAVAVGYNEDEYPAPYIVTKGEGIEAQWIIHEAEILDIPIMRNIPLAHKLYEEGEIYGYVPIDTYEAVAEVLKWVASLQPATADEEDLDI